MSMNRKVKHGKRSPSGTRPWNGPETANAVHPVHRPPNRPRTASRPAFPLVSAVLVGAAGFEPVTSSVSAKPREPLCYTPFSQVTSDRRPGRETLS
jgi:hypothetical protein